MIIQNKIIFFNLYILIKQKVYFKLNKMKKEEFILKYKN